MEKLIDVGCYPVASALDLLLLDKSTGRNIIWATDTYEEYGEGFTDKSQINRRALRSRGDIIRPRIQKSQEAQAERTRRRAEVFTPAWLCNKMNNALDEDWFGRRDVFNIESEGHTWTATEGRIAFPEGKSWRQYVDSRRLEITCGEAPYLVSRYDVSTGELIIPPKRRIGMLDRKLRIVNENTGDYEEWLKWALRALEATYGYEYQGDNVLIARANLLLTFCDYYEERWGRRPGEKLLRGAANRIAWNIWQMDGLRGAAPLGKPYEGVLQTTILEPPGGAPERGKETPPPVLCRIRNWRSKTTPHFTSLKEKCTMAKKLFDYVIGNPPYQEDVKNEGDRANPVYDKFMEATYQIADVVELIHPARFLFNAGQTPKSWNKKMLEDEHLKVLQYEPDARKVFPNTDIKGGVAITLHDGNQLFGAIETFTAFPELNEILSRVKPYVEECSFADIFVPFMYFNLDLLLNDYPDYKSAIGNEGKDKMLRTNIFDRIPLFTERQVETESSKIWGVRNKTRVWRYFPTRYIDEKNCINLYKWKVLIPEANGSGAIGEVLSTPLVGEPLVGYTQTFFGIGAFDSRAEAEACLKYVKSKFARTMLGILKVTQHNPPEKWRYVPLQDFTPASDIDWSKSVHEIDLQLYRKYGLDEKEIEFIETHVKEMA